MEAALPTGRDEWTIDQLAQQAGLPVRTIREYQRLGLVHPPRRAGRVGLYDSGHRSRLQLIGRLQDRGYSLAGIADLLAAWRGGDALSDVLGLEPDQLVHVDEPGAPATIDQLATLLPALVPERLDDLLATGVVEACGLDGYCVPSPSLLQLAIDTLTAGLDVDTVLELLAAFSTAADDVASATLDAFSRLSADAADLEALVARGRGLLVHGMGRLALHRIGRAIGATDDDSAIDLARRITRARQEPRARRKAPE